MWLDYTATDDSLKKLLLNGIDNIYVRTLHDSTTGFSTVSTFTIIQHLYSSYGQITPSSLADKDFQLHTAYDSAQPIESLFHQIDSSHDIADYGSILYMDGQLVIIGYYLLFQSGQYN